MADTQAEEHPMDFLLSTDFGLGVPKKGELKTGEIISHFGNTVMIDIGAKSEGLINPREVDGLDKEIKSSLKPGTEIQVVVVEPEDSDGNIIVSYVEAQVEGDWDTAEGILNDKETATVKVVGNNRGGLLVKMNNLQGFLPLSQIAPATAGNVGDINSIAGKLKHQELTVRILEVDRNRERLIFSEKAVSAGMASEKRKELMEALNEGDVRDGKVVHITDFGAFVEIGDGLQGLVHLSELSWKRIKKPADVVTLGDEVQVSVLQVDMEKDRIALSVKALEKDPWDNIGSLYKEGQLVEAKITKLQPYGAFARLDDEYGIQGLIHISELSADRIEKPNDILRKGEVVTARVIRIDPERHQIGLSIKQVSSEKYMADDLSTESIASTDNHSEESDISEEITE